tara:strand:- start:3785 stop:4858 length:1074 start_codon:yes stop_codon:yes gene_type:complete
MTPVTIPFLPPKKDFELFLDKIWNSSILTNSGPLLVELEKKIQSRLDLNNIKFVTNGTIALQLSIRALGLKGEIITTPFSYVATSSSIVWEGCKPVYVDIDSKSLNIDPIKIESAITNQTSAILATHVFGNPCDIEAIETIAIKHNLKVIYDAAHCFGVKFNNRSIFNFGDISTCSTHATKLFHTIEGGFVVTKCDEIKNKISFMMNFGHNGTDAFHGLGINGKNSEFHAAMGLANLKYMKDIHYKRKLISERYDVNLIKTNLIKPLWNINASKNYAYYPIILKNEKELLKKIEELRIADIYSRRYFYPSLNKGLPYVDKIKNCVVSEDISLRILCLPLYYDLTIEKVDLICEILKK